MGILFLKKYFFRRREKRFVRQIIAQDDSAIEGAPVHERQKLKDLQARWQESINLMKGSYLKKRGNPLYVLPWYLVIGETGAGKTTAVKSSRLTSPLTEVASTQGISSTKNCDWWFFEEAIILDTAGRYTIPIDEGPDKEEWEKFLTLLVKYRKREPINGLIVVVSTDKIMDVDHDVLVEEGQSIRKRIDALMRVLGARFPVYLLVTKADLISGMIDFSSLLPEGILNQAMGHLNESLTNNCEEFLEETMHAVSERLKNIRLELINTNKSINPNVFIFPDEFDRLQPGLQAFVKGAFKESTYQETPLLRGIFFSSGRQGDTPHPAFFQDFLMKEQKDFTNGNK
ncbi:MAG: type VI secretion protein IcmF/TssM N-terminal domain-containing protein [Thermodesulfobacteriota bacterium]|nr:type VI secretion protein IcmF/TssM N-terminal domain-containing protein [Thermodesulfobacteriota bacterium]